MKRPELLDIYSDFLLSSFHLVTATGLSKMLDNGYSHDQISRFLGQEMLSQRDFWKKVKSLIRKVEHDNGLLVIDDVIMEKPHTTENDIICWHWDHAKGRNVKGVNIINFLYHTDLPDGGDFSVPASYEIIRKTEQWYDAKADRVKRRSPVSKNEMVRERLRTIVEINRVRFRYLVWDIWFSSKENLDFVHNRLGKHFVGAVKSNRLVSLGWEDKQQGKFVNIADIGLQQGQCVTVWLKGLEFPVQLTKHVFTNKDGSQGILYLITNDMELSWEEIHSIYQKRWKVEEFHKSLKQNASLEKSPTKYETTQANHVFASMIAWCKLEILKLKEKVNHFGLKNRLYLKAVKAAHEELQRMKTFVKSIDEPQDTLISPLLG